MFSGLGGTQAYGQQSQNSRFQPANNALNSQADGKVVCINMSSNQIATSCFESRIEYLKNGRQPQVGGMGMLGQQQQPMFGGLQQQPNQSFQPFGQSQAPPQTATTTGLFGQQTSQPLFGQPQQPQVNPPAFSLGATPQLGQPQTGGLFGSLGQPQTQTQTGLFGGLSQPQQQPQGLGLQSQQLLQTPQLQQPSMFGVQQTPSLFQPQFQQGSSAAYVSSLPLLQQQLPQGYKIVLVEDKDAAVPDIELNDNDQLQKKYLERMELNLLQNSYPLGYATDSYNYGNNSQQKNDPYYQPKIQRVSNLHLNNSSSNLQRTTIQPRTQQLQQYRNQYKVLSSKSKRTTAMDDRMISQKLSQMAIQPEKGFYLVCSQCQNPVRCFVELNKLKINDQNATVEQLIVFLQKTYLKINDPEPQYQALFTSDGPLNQTVLANDLLLENLEFTRGCQILLVQIKTNQSSIRLSSQSQRHKISFGVQEKIIEKKIPNPNAPTLSDHTTLDLNPSIEQLKFMSDYELSGVENFEVLSDYGHIKFLQPVDLRGLQLDQIISLTQDTVEFYGEEDITPPKGKEINVPCQITFYNFGSGCQDLFALKQSDFEKFTEVVQQQIDDMNMKLIHLDQQKLVVETQQL